MTLKRITGFFFLWLFSGCATLQWMDFPSRLPDIKELPSSFPFRDYTGIFHVHSRYSHDSRGRFDEIVSAARRAGVDFVIVTDHNTLAGLRDKMDGFYDQTLVLIGNELSTQAGHLAVLGVDQEFDSSLGPADILKKVSELGGLSFVCHGESVRKPWSDWAVSPLTGMEIYNLAGDVYEDGKFWVALKVLGLTPRLFFKSVLDKPRAYLERWDSLLKGGPIVGIGAVDAHQKVRIFGKPLDDYDAMFKVVQTHAWSEELSEKAILEAFGKGHVYVGFDLVQPVRNFLFWAEKNEQKWLMGDTLKYEKALKLKAHLPARATRGLFRRAPDEMRVFKDGQLIYRNKTDFAEIDPDGPGIYRVEVYHRKKLWILSNPIYLK